MATSPSTAEAISQLRKYGKYKERSFQTSTTEHLPSVASAASKPQVVLLGSSIIEGMSTTGQPSTRPHPNPPVILLGDSMIERMTTTGQSPSFSPWPSTTLLSEEDAKALSIQQRYDIFNAGVGGDRFENIIFRLAGSDDPSHPLQGLLSAMDCQSIKLWVIQAGTNNLHPRHGMREKDLDVLRLILETLLRVSAPDAKLLLTGLFYRKDVDDRRMDEANREYACMVDDLNEAFASGRVEFLPAPEVDKNSHLVDHVHLNEEGYKVWARVLVPKMMSILGA